MPNEIQKIIDIYEKYVPKNITLEQFMRMGDTDPAFLDSIGGEFSTFNAKIATAFKDTDKTDRKSKNAFKTIMKDSLDADVMEQRVQEIAKLYEEIISSSDEILTAAWTFDILTEEQIQQLANNIISAMNSHLNIDKTINFVYTNEALNNLPSESSSNKIYNFVKKFVSRFKRKKSKYGRWGGYYSSKKGEIVIAHNTFFATFISVLSHEYGHFIDRNYPNLGMLGEQIMFYGLHTHSSGTTDNEGYMLNPTEISSYKIGEIVSKHISNVLEKQAQQKPELYIKTLQSAIDMIQLKINAKYLKAKKAEKEYYDIRSKTKDELYPIFHLLPEEKQKQAWAKIDRDPRLRDYAKVKREYFQIYNKVSDERYPNLYELPHAEQSRIRTEINQDSRVIIYKQKYDELNNLRNELRDERYPFFYKLPLKEQERIMAKIESKPRVKIAYLKYKIAKSDEYTHLSVVLHDYENLLEDFKKSLSLTNTISDGKVRGF